MYLARFETAAGEWLQGTARIHGTSISGPKTAEDPWTTVGRALSAAARIPDATVARRIAVGPHGVVETIALTTPTEHEARLREAPGRLTSVERAYGRQVSLPQDHRERDAWMNEVGAIRAHVSRQDFAVRGQSLACDFRTAEALDDLFGDALAGEYTLSYQLHVRAMRASADDVRTARKGMLRLHDFAGSQVKLVEWQDGLARALGHAVAMLEEYLAVDASAAADSVSALLTERFSEAFGALAFPRACLTMERDAYEESIVNAVHSHDLEPWPPVALCGVAVTATERDRMLSWAPSRRLHRLLEQAGAGAAAHADARPESSEPTPALDAGLRLPDPHSGDGPYAFVSYKRQDLPRIAPMLQLLWQSGVSVWYDRGIPGGAEWDQVIEDKVAHARYVVLFASQAALDSKYVRREVKFADALNLPILPIALEDILPEHGMRMLLSQYQTIDARAGNLSEKIRYAVARFHEGPNGA